MMVNQVNLEDIHHKMEEREYQAKKVIEDLGKSKNAEKLFIAVAMNISIGPADEMDEMTYGTVPAKLELLAFCLYPFFGKSQDDIITPWDTNNCIEALDELFRSSILSQIDFSEKHGENEISSHLLSRAKIVRGSAYPEQISGEIESIQGKYEDWFQKKVGVGPKRAVQIIWAIFNNQQNSLASYLPKFQENGNKWQKLWIDADRHRENKESKEILDIFKESSHAYSFGFVEALNKFAPEIIPVSYANLKKLTPIPSQDEWDALINLIGITTEKRNVMSFTIDVRQTPLFVFPDKRVLIIDRPNAFDALWQKFELEAKNDPVFYQKYQETRTDWLENSIYHHVSKIFPSESIFTNLSYPDPEKEEKSTAEIDLIIQWGPFLVLIEAKARQFRLESQLGDIAKLTNDLKRNIEDAHFQAKRAVEYIEKTSPSIFREIKGKRILVISKQRIKRIYLLTISLHNLNGLATEMDSLQELGLFKDNEFPYSVSISDFEIITEFCESPDIFLHHIERRIYAQKHMENFHADELDWFGAYLDTRLQPYRFIGKDNKKYHHKRRAKYNYISLSGWSDQFDKWSLYKKGESQIKPDIHLKIPKEINSLLIELRKRDDDGARWISFALLDMSDEILAKLSTGFREIRNSSLTPGRLRRTSIQVENTVITLVASMDDNLEFLDFRTYLWTMVEKYRRKAIKSIGFSIDVNNMDKFFNSAFWVEAPWVFDEQFEILILEEPPFDLVKGGKLPEKNSPCFCGSGKKFKDCCWPKILKSRKLLNEE